VNSLQNDYYAASLDSPIFVEILGNTGRGHFVPLAVQFCREFCLFFAGSQPISIRLTQGAYPIHERDVSGDNFAVFHDPGVQPSSQLIFDC
jgi:hypothetical protein